MKTAYSLVLLALAVLLAGPRLQAQTIIAGPGGTYANPFASEPSVTYDPAPSGNPLLSLVLDSSGSTGNVTEGIWTMNAQGGSNVSSSLLGVVEQSGAQVSVAGSALQFNRDNAPGISLLGALGTGTNLNYGWSAAAAFGGINYQANTQYTLDFSVDGHGGLLGTVAGITPTFDVEFVDASGHPLTVNGGGTLIDIAGLLGTGVPSGNVSISLNTGSTAPTGPVSVKFVGDVTVGASALGIGTNYATVSNLSVDAQPVPEPAGASLVMACGMCVLFRRRRLGRLG